MLHPNELRTAGLNRAKLRFRVGGDKSIRNNGPFVRSIKASG